MLRFDVPPNRPDRGLPSLEPVRGKRAKSAGGFWRGFEEARALFSKVYDALSRINDHVVSLTRFPLDLESVFS